MFAEIRSALRPSLVLLGVFTLLCGVAYPLLVTGIAQVVFPAEANGSLLTRNGRIIGSALIAQPFASDRYIHPRPSAAGKGWDAMASSGSNLAANAQALHDRVAADLARERAADGTAAIPADLVTASGSGLDPDISPEAAMVQAARVARARHWPVARVRELIAAQVQDAAPGLIGQPRVNVLRLNLALDAADGR